MSNAKLSTMWQSLMGEPIEDYKFYWDRGFLMRYGEYVHQTLGDYPDLLARFEDLTPSFTLKFEVKSGCKKNIGCSHSFTHTVSSNDILIKRASEVPDFSVPSSYTWPRFFGKSESSDSEEITELKNAFINAEYLDIISVEIHDIQWPQSLDIIWEELLRRRKQSSENKDVKSNSNASTEEWTSDENQSSNKTDPSANQDSEWATETSNETEEWASSSSESKSSKPIIEAKDGKYGVIDTASGEVLIPFNFEHISKFENGLATVSKLVLEEVVACDYQSVMERILNYYEEGTVDITGQYVIPPHELLVVSKKTLISLSTGNKGYSAKRERCKETILQKVKVAKDQVIANGGVVR